MLAACVNIFLAKLYLFCRWLPQVVYGWIRRTENCAALLPVVRYNIFIAFEACLCRSGHTYSIALGSGMCTSGYISTSRAYLGSHLQSTNSVKHFISSSQVESCIPNLTTVHAQNHSVPNRAIVQHTVLTPYKQTNKNLRCCNRKGLLGRNDQTHHRMGPQTMDATPPIKRNTQAYIQLPRLQTVRTHD